MIIIIGNRKFAVTVTPQITRISLHKLVSVMYKQTSSICKRKINQSALADVMYFSHHLCAKCYSNYSR